MAMYIIKCGNCTPLGERAGVTAASVRAGFAMISLNPEYEDDDLEPIRLGLAEYIDKRRPIEQQFQDLSHPALSEVFSFFEKQQVDVKEFPVFVGMPASRPGVPPGLERLMKFALLSPPGTLGFGAKITCISQGHTSCLEAMAEAENLLSAYEFCVVGGVDSYHHAETLTWLELEQKRLFCTDNKDGFIPGQAAGFLLLASPEAVDKYRLQPMAKVHAVALGEEDHPFASGKMPTANGLTRAVRKVLEYLPEEEKVDAVYSTLNGEDYHTQEMTYTLINVGQRIREVGDVIAPYSCWGDLGAATVPVLIGLMTEAGKKNYARGPMNLITAANLGKQRGSALIELLNLDGKE